MDRVLLTGGSGFIGSHVLEALTAADIPVTVLVRRTADLTHVLPLRPEVRQGDLRDLAGVCEAVRGCAGVIHTAAQAKDWGRRGDFWEANVTGTLNVLEAARRHGIRRAIITGSISSYGEEDSRETKDETFPYRSHYPYFLDRWFACGFNHYRDSKAEASEQAVRFAQNHGMDLTLIEPVWVFGEREFGTGFYSYVKAVQAGTRFMPGSRRNRFQVIYARDLAKAYVLAWRARLPGVERIIVGNREAEPMHRIFGRFCREAGLEPPRLLPKWRVYPAGLAGELAYTLGRSQKPPLLTRGRVNMFYDSIQYSTEKARRRLGFECDHTLEEGIRRTVAWYRQHHFL